MIEAPAESVTPLLWGGTPADPGSGAEDGSSRTGRLGHLEAARLVQMCSQFPVCHPSKSSLHPSFKGPPDCHAYQCFMRDGREGGKTRGAGWGGTGGGGEAWATVGIRAAGLRLQQDVINRT